MNSASVAGNDRAVPLGEDRRQDPGLERRQPEPQQMAFAMGFRPVLEAGAIVQQCVIVDKLDIAGPELHEEMQGGIVGKCVEAI